LREEQIVAIPEENAIFQGASRGINPHQLKLKIGIPQLGSEKLIYRWVVLYALNVHPVGTNQRDIPHYCSGVCDFIYSVCPRHEEMAVW